MKSRRLFHWAEIMWIDYCVRKGKTAVQCAALMRDRLPETIQRKARDMGMPFPSRNGAPIGHKPYRTAFNSETGKIASSRRWGR